MDEIWKEIPEFRYYEVSNQGRVRSKDYDQVIQLPNGKYSTRRIHGKILTPVLDKRTGNLLVTLTLGCDKLKQRSVHRMVAEVFVPNLYNYQYVVHLDGDKTNNIYTNLVWAMSSKTSAVHSSPQNAF